MGSFLDAMLGTPYAPQSPRAKSLAETVQKAYGMAPNVERLNILPNYTPDQGWIAPQWLYEAAKATALPGHVMSGGAYTPEDVTNMAMTVAGGGFGASGLGGGVPRGALGAHVWQGGPHKYGQEGAAQSLQHVGTGVADAMTLGWGRYDTGSKKYAEGYAGSFDGGHLYKHDLPDEDVARYMVWEKAIKDQPQTVKDAVSAGDWWRDPSGRLVNMEILSPPERSFQRRQGGAALTGSEVQELTGREVYQALSGAFGSKRMASEYLGGVNIPGLRSSGGGSGDTFVTWDHDVLSRMKLLERNGEKF